MLEIRCAVERVVLKMMVRKERESVTNPSAHGAQRERGRVGGGQKRKTGRMRGRGQLKNRFWKQWQQQRERPARHES